MTNHTWIQGAIGDILDPANYEDGQPFVAGDGLFVTSGIPSARSPDGSLVYLPSGNYEFLSGPGGPFGVSLYDIAFDASNLVGIESPQPFTYDAGGLSENDGYILVGGADGPGTVTVRLDADGARAPVFDNHGTIWLETASLVDFVPNDAAGTIINEAGATIRVTEGSRFQVSAGSATALAPTFRNNGTIILEETGSSLVIETAYTGTGTLLLGDPTGPATPDISAEIQGPASGTFDIFVGTLSFSRGNPVTGTVNFGSGGGLLRIAENPATHDPSAFQSFGATIEGLRQNDAILLDGNLDYASDAYDPATHQLTLYSEPGDQGQILARLDIDGDYTTDNFALSHVDSYGGTPTESADAVLIQEVVACYCRGTRIATLDGERPVETLRIGDLLPTLDGTARPIRWIGTRCYSGRFLANNRAALPIRIRAGALSDNIPSRDLLVSPLHAMYLDGMLLPAATLVNGVSIAALEHAESVEYFHIELDSHDIILAEGAASETFVDDDSRAMFHNRAEHAALYPDHVPVPALYCAPRIEQGMALEQVRRRLAERANPHRDGTRQDAA